MFSGLATLGSDFMGAFRSRYGSIGRRIIEAESYRGVASVVGEGAWWRD